jgi:hypothetical protein
MHISAVVEKYGYFPIPKLIGTGEKKPCCHCEQPSDLVYLAGYVAEQPIGFTACDDLCAGMVIVEMLEATRALDPTSRNDHIAGSPIKPCDVVTDAHVDTTRFGDSSGS